MMSKNELISQLRGRRRSVEAEIKRMQEEQPIDATRAATNEGYRMALEVEAAFLAGILAQGDKQQQSDWLDDLIADVRKEQQQKP